MALVPILMYHEVQDPARPNPSAPPSWTVDIDSFRQQMERLRSAGYTGMSVSRWLAERPIQRCRPVVLTFDDGLRGNIDHALPVLLEMGWTATFFITTAMIGNEGYGAPDEWRDASDKGMDIASHGVTHTPLGALDSESALGELMHSRNVLETAVGIPVVGWSWPHGDIPPDGIAMLQTSGYQWAATSREALARDGEAPFSLPRPAYPIVAHSGFRCGPCIVFSPQSYDNHGKISGKIDREEPAGARPIREGSARTPGRFRRWIGAIGMHIRVDWPILV